MAIRDIVQAAAGVGGDKLYVEDVFSTYLYTGNSTTQTNANGIDLDGEGGLVWLKWRSGVNGFGHALYDTERGITKELKTETSGAESTENRISSFNSSGFTLTGNTETNYAGDKYASWSWRKAPKFFSVVTWTGTGVAGRTVAHDLGSVPGMIIVKRTDGAGMWRVFHRSLGATKNLYLNDTSGALTQSDIWNDTAPTDAVFTVGDSGNVNGSGFTYVAYVFAHNDAGGFGDDGEQNVISCGSYTGTGVVGNEVTLGFEPQWLLVKSSSLGENWWLVDVMRGMPVENYTGAKGIRPNTNSAEATPFGLYPTATGFVLADGGGAINENNATYIYMAIRRPMKTPESGTEVFAIDLANNTGSASVPEYVSGFPVDFAIAAPTGGDYIAAGARLIQGKRFYINKPAGESEDVYSAYNFAFQNGWFNEATSGKYAYMFKRASKAFDVVCYDGNGSNQTIAHNLNAVPEFIFTRRRDTTVTRYINVYNKTIGATKRFQFRASAVETSTAWNNTEPTSSVFSVGNQMETNNSGSQYIAWMFASVAGVIKVGTYTGTGSDLSVDCGFSNGARFVLIKGVTQGGTGNGAFYLWDSTRGISSGNDPYYRLSENAPAVTNTDYVDPLASGFTVTSNASTFVNVSGNEYIFLAIA